MPAENLQTIIVSKLVAGNLREAKKIAKTHSNKLLDVDETGTSWRFRQKSPSKFKKGSFRSFKVPKESGVTLVYGSLIKNPPVQIPLDLGGSDRMDVLMSDWGFILKAGAMIVKADSADDLSAIAKKINDRDIKSEFIKKYAIKDIANMARKLNITDIPEGQKNDIKIYESLLRERKENPPPKKKIGQIKTMPDPGECAWLGSLIEFAWVPDSNSTKATRYDDKGNAIWAPREEWMFLWSPEYKAVVSIKRPNNMYKELDAKKYKSAKKMFEVFMARPAENAFSVDVPKVKMVELGNRAAHIVYRSDKWSSARKSSDYIHDFKATCNSSLCRSKNVKLYCGPSIDRPEVFICLGGRLTLTERGLVF